MLNEDNNVNPNDPTITPPEESSNRTFLIVGGVMAGLVFVTLVCMGIYLLVIRPGQTAKTQGTQTAVARQNAQNIQQNTQTAGAALWTPTLVPSNTPVNTSTNTSVPAIINTPTFTRTSVVVVNTPSSTPTTDPATAIAMQTQLAAAMTATASAAGTRGIGGEGMPTTGFADQVGLPTLIILAVALLVIIFVARRLRRAPAK
jgi:hypothetical protein